MLYKHLFKFDESFIYKNHPKFKLKGAKLQLISTKNFLLKKD